LQFTHSGLLLSVNIAKPAPTSPANTVFDSGVQFDFHTFSTRSNEVAEWVGAVFSALRFRKHLASICRYASGCMLSATGMLLLAVLTLCSIASAQYTQTTIPTSNVEEPSAVAVDTAGNIYLANSLPGQVLKETLQANGTYVQTTIVSGLNDPFGLAVDGNGNLYIANFGNCQVLEEGLEFRLGGGEGYHKIVYYQYPQLTEYSIYCPQAVAVDGSGNVYSAASNGQTGYGSVAKLTPSASGGPTVSVIIDRYQLNPEGVVVQNNGAILISDRSYFGTPGTGVFDVFIETPSSGSYLESTAIFSGTPSYYGGAMALDAIGNLYITIGTNQVAMVPFSGGPSEIVLDLGATLPSNYFLTGIAVDSSDNLYLSAGPTTTVEGSTNDGLLLKETLTNIGPD